jgi:hypothetical protein
MKRLLIFISALAILAIALGYASQSGIAQDDKIPRKPDQPMDKREFYNRYVAPKYGRPALAKPSTFLDRKRSVLDVGKLVVRHNNAGTWGYDRWGLNHQWPAGSSLTYYWTLGPMIAAKKRLPDGKLGIAMATGVFGTVRDHEDEFQPLPGYDAGEEFSPASIGIAYSDHPETWPAQWPIEIDANGTYRDLYTQISLPGIERPLDKQQPGGRNLRFPGAYNGAVVADREAYMVMTDNDPKDGNSGQFNKGVGPLNVRVDAWAMQWSDILNEDFIIWRHIFTNVGPDTLYDVYVGMHGDPDTPEQGANEWTDDFAIFIPQGSAQWDPLLWNTVIIWDGDDKSAGFIEKNVPWISIKVLETPNDPVTGAPKGLTTMYLFLYSEDAQSDEQAYTQQMTSGIEQPDNVQPHPSDFTQTPNSYGPDITFVFASGPFTLPPGASLPFTLADILGANRADVLTNSTLAQVLFNNNYRAAESPKEPWVRAVPGDRTVTLYWDASPAETALDRLTGNNRFQGYRIFRSDDRGLSWGRPITDVNGTVVNYVPLAQFDLNDDINGVDPTAPFLYLGDNTGLVHKYVDNNVINGYEYWYAVCAYDSRDEFKANPTDPVGIPVPPLENSRKSNPETPGDNTVAVVPRPNVAGFKAGQVTGPARVSGHGTGEIAVELLDNATVQSDEFTLKFDDTGGQLALTITNKAGAVIVDKSTAVSGEENIPVFNNVRLKVTNHAMNVLDAQRAGFFAGNTEQQAATNYTLTINPASSAINEADYEVRFTARGDTSISAILQPAIRVPFEIWNVYDRSNPRQVDFSILQAASDTTQQMRTTWTSGDQITTREIINNSRRPSWIITMTAPAEGDPVLPQTGDVARAYLTHPFKSEDVLKITTVAATTDPRKEELAGIKVVPNPYVVSSIFETSLISKQIQFRHLPPVCTIRLYNLAGELVRVIEHTNGTSIEAWDLRSYNDQEVSFGVYIYHVTTPAGLESLGKFAVIK